MQNKKAVLLAVILISLLCLLSCKSAQQEEAQDPWYTYSDASLYVKLDANYTTGYQWTATIDGTSLQLTQENYTPHEAPSDMVGVGGTWTCTLTAACDGLATVRLIYARPWDKTDIAEIHTLKVSVSNGKISNVEEK